MWLLRRGCKLVKAEGRPKVKVLGDQEMLNLSLVSKYFDLNGQWGQTVHLTIYETKNRNLVGRCLAMS